MIYVCVPSYNEASTIGVLLWKIRNVFRDFPREYQLLVCDDGSTDATAEVLVPYTKFLPLTLYRQSHHRGYAASVETLLRHAVDLTDKPKRDFVVLLQADFTHDASTIPDLVRRMESGADLAVAEARIQGSPTRAHRWVRRWAPVFFRKRAAVPGVSDVLSGYFAARLVAVRNAFRLGPPDGPFLTSEGWAANAELLGTIAKVSRRIESVPTVERHDLRQRASRIQPWRTAQDLWRQSRGLSIPTPEPPAAGDADQTITRLSTRRGRRTPAAAR